MADYGDLSGYGNQRQRLTRILDALGPERLRALRVIGHRGRLRPDGIQRLVDSGEIRNPTRVSFLRGLAGAARPAPITQPPPAAPQTPSLPPAGRIPRGTGGPADVPAAARPLGGEVRGGPPPRDVPPPPGATAPAPAPVSEPAVAPVGADFGDLSRFGNRRQRISRILSRIDPAELQAAGVLDDRGQLAQGGLARLAQSGLVRNPANVEFISGVARVAPPAAGAPASKPAGGGLPAPPPRAGGGAPPAPPPGQPPEEKPPPPAVEPSIEAVPPAAEAAPPPEAFNPAPWDERISALETRFGEGWSLEDLMKRFDELERRTPDWTQGGPPPEQPGWRYRYRGDELPRAGEGGRPERLPGEPGRPGAGIARPSPGELQRGGGSPYGSAVSRGRPGGDEGGALGNVRRPPQEEIQPPPPGAWLEEPGGPSLGPRAGGGSEIGRAPPPGGAALPTGAMLIDPGRPKPVARPMRPPVFDEEERKRRLNMAGGGRPAIRPLGGPLMRPRSGLTLPPVGRIPVRRTPPVRPMYGA